MTPFEFKASVTTSGRVSDIKGVRDVEAIKQVKNIVTHSPIRRSRRIHEYGKGLGDAICLLFQHV